MANVEPYTLEQAQDLVKDAVQRSHRRHGRWAALEQLYRTGIAEEQIERSAVPDRLWTEIDGLTLEGINLVLPYMQVIILTSMAHDPAFLVEPWAGGEGVEDAATKAEELLRYFWKRTRGTDIHRQMVQDFAILGNGFCKVGWSFAEQVAELEDDDLEAELAAFIEAEENEAELEDRDERSVDELITIMEAVNNEIVEDEPFIEYVSPYDVFVPVNARRIEEARWIAHRVILPYDEVIANPAFENTDHLVPTSREDRPGKREEDEQVRSGEPVGFEDDPFAEVTLFEFYDMRTRRMLVFQEDSEKALYDDELPYSHRYPPIVHMRNFEDGGSRFWAFGDLENVAAIQHQFNEFIEEQLSSARRAGAKYAVDKDLIDDDMMDLLTAEESDVVVPVKLGKRNINDVVTALERKPTDPEVFKAIEDLSMRMREVLGLNDFQTGGSGADRMSATAAAVVDGTATLRASDKKYQVERAASRTGLRILLLCQEHLAHETAVRVVGSTGIVEWLSVDPDELGGEFGVNVESGSTMAINPATRQQRAVEMMTNIIPAMAAEGYDTHPIWRKALRDWGLDPDQYLQKAPMPPAAPGGQGGGQQAGAPTPQPGGPAPEPTVEQEELGGPPVPAAVGGDVAL